MGNFAKLAVRASFFLFGKLIFVGKPFQSLISDFQKKTLLNSMGTPPKFNIAPEKWWLEDDPFLLGREPFRGYVRTRSKSLD